MWGGETKNYKYKLILGHLLGCKCIHKEIYVCVHIYIFSNVNVPVQIVHLYGFYSDAHCYLIFFPDSNGISVMLSLSYSASDGNFWNLITACTALISDGTFDQKGNQKVIHLWDSLQSQWSHNTTCWKGLLAFSPYVAIKSNWLLSSQHPHFLLQNTA